MNDPDNLTSWEREHRQWMREAVLAMGTPDTSWARTLRDIRALPETSR